MVHEDWHAFKTKKPKHKQSNINNLLIDLFHQKTWSKTEPGSNGNERVLHTAQIYSTNK